MNRQSEQGQAQPQNPWYREFWPWFIIALIGSVVLASFLMIWLAVKHNDPRIQGGYKKEGLGIVISPEPASAEEAAAEITPGAR